MSQYGAWNMETTNLTNATRCQVAHTPHDTTEDINMFDTTVFGKFSKCCVCQRLLPQHSKARALPAHESTEDAVCSNSCFQILTQTVCFVQGFILGKVLCSFLGFHSKEKTVESLDVKPEISAVGRIRNQSCPYDDDGLSNLPVLFCLDSVSRGSSSGQVPERSIEAADQSLLFGPPAFENSALAAGVNSHRMNSIAGVKVEPWESSADAAFAASAELFQSSASSSSKLYPDTLFPPINSNSGFSTNSTPAVNFAQDKNVKRKRSKKSGDDSTRVGCTRCGKVLRNQTALSNHLRSHHMLGRKPLRTCQVCGEKYEGWSSLVHHMRTLHEDVKPVSCDLCEEKFHTSEEYKRHQTMSHGKKYGMCHICGKDFTYRGTLMRHIQAHSGVRRFVCEHCGKGFLRQTTLIDHKTWAHLCVGCKKIYANCICPGGPRKKRNSQRSKRKRKLNSTATKETSQEKLKKAKPDILQCPICGEIRENLFDYEAHIKAHTFWL